MSPHNNSPPPFSYGTSAQNRNPPATPPSSAGTPSLISALRSTPRGQLKYDRTGPAPSRLSGVTPVSFPPLEDGPSSSVIIATPTRLSSPPPLTGSTSHNCSWHSVMEEVTEEMRQVKIQTLYSITARMNQKVKNKDLKITLGKNIEVDVNVEGPERVVEEYHSPRVEVVIPEDPPLEVPIIKDKPAKSKRKPRTPKKCVRFEFDSPEKENSPEKISAFLSPTSPIDEEIKRYEWDRQKQVEVSNLKRREKFQKARENIWATALNEMNSRLKVIQDEEEKKRVQLERELEEEQRREHQMQMNALQEAQKQRDLRRMASLQELEDIQIQKAQLIEESVVQLTFAMEAVGKAIDGHSGNTQSRRDVDHLLEEARVVLAKAEDTELATDVGIIETLIAKFRDCTNQLLEEKRCQQERLQREDAVRKKQAEAEQSLLKQQQLQQEEVAKVADQKKLEQERAEKAAQARAQQQQQYTQHQQQQVASQAVTSAAGDSGTVSGASESNLKIYMTVLKEKADWQKNIAPLAHTSNPAEKTFKFACQKAVNVPVNGINATSSNHLQDKLEKLQKLLRGQDIEYSEGKQLNAAGNPCGIAFCKFLLAEKFIQQGEDVVSVKLEYAFPMSAVILALWHEFPDFGHLFLTTLYEYCPYMLPHAIPRDSQESEAQHLKKLGFKIGEDGKVEDEDQFIKRMTGIARIYAALAISVLPKSFPPGSDSPFGLAHIWSWLASVMNLQPINDVTATLIYDVLEVAGHAMIEAYGSAFKKLLLALCSEFFPKIQMVTKPGRSSPVARLEEFLRKTISSGEIKKPESQLKPGFL